jgi:hypothetical protein
MTPPARTFGAPRAPLLAGLLALAALGASGCVQLETRIKIETDGTATVTERLRFSRRVLDLAGEKQADLLKMLSRDAALRRMKKMGEGISVASHKSGEAAGASQESVTVFKVKDLNKFRYVTPWLAYKDFPKNNHVKFWMKPWYKSSPYAGPKAGTVAIGISYPKRPVGERRPKKGEKPPKGPSPLEQQVYRELGPMFRDMLKGFHVRFTIESYAPVHSGLGVRGARAGAKEVDLINFSDKDLDSWGGLFLKNEEIMLDLVRWELGSADIVRHVRGYAGNHTLPVYFPAGSKHMWWSGGNTVWFRPSKPIFDRWFVGKKLDYSQWRASPPSKHVPATFARIGYHPRKRKNGDEDENLKAQLNPEEEPKKESEPEPRPKPKRKKKRRKKK